MFGYDVFLILNTFLNGLYMCQCALLSGVYWVSYFLYIDNIDCFLNHALTISFIFKSFSCRRSLNVALYFRCF